MSDEQMSRLGAMFESLTKDIKAVAEGVVMMNQRIDALAADMDRRFREVHEKIDFWVAVMHERFDKVETRVGRLEEFADARQRFDRLETQGAETQQRLGRLETQGAETQQRLGRLETQGAETQQRLGRLETQGAETRQLCEDSQQRIKRIEGHLQLRPARGTRTPPRATRTPVVKRDKKS